MTLRVNKIERLAQVQLGDPLQSEIVELIENTVKIEPRERLRPHVLSAGVQRTSNQRLAIGRAAFHEHPGTYVGCRRHDVTAQIERLACCEREPGGAKDLQKDVHDERMGFLDLVE